MTAHLLARVGSERFAFGLSRVLEALDAPTMHDAPMRPDGMLGTLRHRGVTVTVWDSARAFGVPRGALDGTALVLGEAGRPLALLVDDALDIVDISPDALQMPPQGTDAASVLAGVACDANGLVCVVKVDALVRRLEAWGARSEG